MRRFWLRFSNIILLTLLVLGPYGLFDEYRKVQTPVELSNKQVLTGFSQDLATETPPTNGTSAYITQTYSEAINVRTGPSTVDYPTVGKLPVGATAPALATSPHHEWIEIEFPGGPGGVGWIYAANVTLTGTLQVVEPPPTQTPVATATIDPTLAAAFSIQPTATRLPTFTPAPPLVIPTYQDPVHSETGFPIGGAIIAIVLIGVLVLVVSFFVRR
jgi:uncharacterized protein YraI